MPIDLGTPGASARAEFERRLAIDDQRRRERFGRFLAPVMKLLTGASTSTLAWDRGSRGEAEVGAYLHGAVGDAGLVLHDRAITGTRSNIDHIAIVASGIWVIDTKRYEGRVQHRRVGGWCRSAPALFVNGHDHTELVLAVQRQSARVQQVVGTAAPIHGALCFTGSEWGRWARPFAIDGVTVTWAGRLGVALRAPGPLGHDAIWDLAQRIARAFPRYDVGTSHRPTGAIPSA